MKVLLLSVALLFFTGAQGRHFWQQDEPNQEAAAEETLEKIVHDSVAIVTTLLQHLDYSDIAEQYHIKERLEAARINAKKLEKALEQYYDEAFKKFDDQLHERFPIFRTKVVPKLKEFDDAVEEHLKKLVNEFLPVGSNLLSGVSKNIVSFFENLENIAEKGVNNLRAEMDSLRVKLQPYVDDVHAEYEKYRKSVEDKFQKDYKDLKQEVQKNMEQINQHAKPHIENLRSKFPDGKEFQEQLEKFLKEVKEAFEGQE